MRAHVDTWTPMGAETALHMDVGSTEVWPHADTPDAGL
jgi:hypothetical protein